MQKILICFIVMVLTARQARTQIISTRVKPVTAAKTDTTVKTLIVPAVNTKATTAARPVAATSAAPATTGSAGPVFTPSPAFTRAFNWYASINPSLFGINYSAPPGRQSFYDSAMLKLYNLTELPFANLPYSPGLVNIQADSLVHLNALPNLRTVTINLSLCNKSVLQRLAALPQLTGVIYPYDQGGVLPASFSFDIDDASVNALLQKPGFSLLQLTNCAHLSNQALTACRNKTSLTSLLLNNCPGVGDAAMLSLQGCSGLETLGFRNCGVSMTGLESLKSILNTLPRLKTLYYISSLADRDTFFAFINACKTAGYSIKGIW